MANTSKSPATRAKRKSRPLAFPLEFRLRIVKLYLEEGYRPVQNLIDLKMPADARALQILKIA
jgi:transposase-like protein